MIAIHTIKLNDFYLKFVLRIFLIVLILLLIFRDKSIAQIDTNLTSYKENELLIIKEFYENGNIKSKKSYNNKSNFLEGYSYKYYSKNNYQPEEIQLYKNGKRNGIYEYYLENGNLFVKSYYKENLKDSISCQYHEESGTIDFCECYKEGKKNGLATYYNSKNNKIEEGFYKENLKVGIWRIYDNGVLKEEGEYYPEIFKSTETIPLANGDYAVFSEDIFKKDGEWKLYDSNGIFIKSSFYKKGKLVSSKKK
jgi:antitoxin component YwqK of YwqJK toxin-antitoxin module